MRHARKLPCQAPQTAEVGTKDEVSRINEEDVTGSCRGGVERGLKFGLQKLPLDGDVLAQRLFGGTGTAPRALPTQAQILEEHAPSASSRGSAP